MSLLLLGDARASELAVTIEPAEAITAGAQWRVFDGVQFNQWNPGSGLLTLSPGSYTVQFLPISGWVTPASQDVTLKSGDTTAVTGTYVRFEGQLNVIIEPAGAVTAGAQWRVFDGVEFTAWHAGSHSIMRSPGIYTVQFGQISDWTTPASQDVTITSGGTTEATGNYVPLEGLVPRVLNYQGRVTVGDPPVNFDGTGAFKFALVNASGGTSYWSNDATSTGGGEPSAAVTLPVTKGLYSVLLGNSILAHMTAIPASVFDNADVHLRVWFNDGVNGFQHLTPDHRIAAVGYAMKAGDVPDGSITHSKIASGAVESDKLAANLTISGAFTAGSFQGSGSGLTNIPASAVTGTLAASQVATPPPGMILIPAGEFMMGNTVAEDSDIIMDAQPVSTTVSAFYMDVTEVTLSQWQSVYFWATNNGYTFADGAGKGPNHPVHTVSWYDVVKWCNARSEQAGKTPVYYTNDAQTTIYKTGNVDVTNAQVKWTANGYRLPTEAEWEKAARGGLSGQRFPWGNTISQNLANYFGSVGGFDQGPNGYNAIGSVGGTSPATSPVGSFAANGYGLHDMAGNVLEWCWDRYGTPYAGGMDPHGAATGSDRVLRGGRWGSSASVALCAFRSTSNLGLANSSFGFRAVLAPGQ